jgi:hypothetical protein
VILRKYLAGKEKGGLRHCSHFEPSLVEECLEFFDTIVSHRELGVESAKAHRGSPLQVAQSTNPPTPDHQ